MPVSLAKRILQACLEQKRAPYIGELRALGYRKPATANPPKTPDLFSEETE